MEVAKKCIDGTTVSSLDSCGCKFWCANPVLLTENAFSSLPPVIRVNISNDVPASSNHNCDIDYSVFITYFDAI